MRRAPISPLISLAHLPTQMRNTMPSIIRLPTRSTRASPQMKNFTLFEELLDHSTGRYSSSASSNSANVVHTTLRPVSSPTSSTESSQLTEMATVLLPEEPKQLPVPWDSERSRPLPCLNHSRCWCTVYPSSSVTSPIPTLVDTTKSSGVYMSVVLPTC
jgi:hypothetical protein